MDNNSTQLNLVKFLYQESNAAESLEVLEALKKDPALRSEYKALQKAKNEFPKVKFNPSKSSIEAILRYSKETALEEHV